MRITLLIALTIWLAACGQKGALYLPVAGKPPPGANEPACASCAPIKVPSTSSESAETQPNQEPKVILQPEAASKSDKTEDKDKSSDTNTSTTDSTQETTQ